LVLMLQRALQAARASPPQWSRVELLLVRASELAADSCALAEDGTPRSLQGADGEGGAADRVRKAATALKRRRRVGSALQKVREVRAAASTGEARGSEEELCEAELLELLTALLTDELRAQPARSAQTALTARLAGASGASETVGRGAGKASEPRGAATARGAASARGAAASSQFR